jgi:putative MATE family efflux protein
MDNEQPALEPAPTTAVLVHSRAHPWRLVTWLAWPVLVQQLLIWIVNRSDGFLAGYFQPGAGEHVAYQSAQTNAMYLSWAISSFTVLVGAGGTALVARFIGAGDRKAAIAATNQCLLIALCFGLLTSIAGLLGSDGIVWLLQLRGAAAEYAASYLRPLFLLLVFQVIETAGIACLVGAGDTRTGPWVLGGVAVLNLPLAWGFFHGFGPLPALGFQGISLGTALSNVVGGLAVLVVLARRRAGLWFHWRLLRPHWQLLWRLLRIGVPAGIDSIFVALSQLWFLSVVNQLSYAEITAHGVALGWEALSFLSGQAFGIAAMTLIGQNLGAGRPDRAGHSGWTAFGLGCAFMTFMGLIFFVLAAPMFRMYCPHEDQIEAVQAGVPVLQLVAFATPAMASTIIFTHALRGAGDTRVPVLFTALGFLVIRLPLAYVLALPEVSLRGFGSVPGWGLGLWGAWLAMFADLYVRGGLFVYRFVSGRWKWVQV